MRRTGLIWLAMVLAFGGLGIMYAHWSDNVQIEGTVHMGTLTLALKWEPPMIVDNEPYLPEPKDVGWGEVFFEEYFRDVHTLKDGYKTLVLVVHNAYPCYKIYFGNVILHNIGLIPIHIVDIKIWDPTGVLNFEWDVPPPRSPALGVFWKDFNGDAIRQPDEEDIINVDIVDFVCTQLDYCEVTKGEIDLHFKQPAEECHTYEFKVHIEGVQWNKA